VFRELSVAEQRYQAVLAVTPVAGRERVRRGRSSTYQVPPRRSTSELAAFLAPRLVTTVGVLRRSRLTLRVVVAAQKEGLVDVDLVSGRVALLTRSSRHTAAVPGPLAGSKLDRLQLPEVNGGA
jgi:hypothetical protein